MLNGYHQIYHFNYYPFFAYKPQWVITYMIIGRFMMCIFIDATFSFIKHITKRVRAGMC